MDEKTRVHKDIAMFEKNIAHLHKKTMSKAEEKIVSLARQYYEDTKYYHGKQDYFTAFGCVNYAHGLLDAILKTKEQGEESHET